MTKPHGPGVVLLVLALAGCTTEVVGGLDQAQSQEALAALAEEGIAAQRDTQGEGGSRLYGIEVAHRDTSRAAVVLRSRGIPRAAEAGFESLYSSAGMIPTPTEERARFLSALGGQIASHLEQLEGVVDASVIVTSPERDPLLQPRPADPATASRASASVLLKISARTAGPPEADVKRLVSGAVEGLAPADVAIVMQKVELAQATAAIPRWRDPMVLLLAAAFVVIILMGLWILVGARRGLPVART